MNRRGFIQITSVALLPLLLGVFPKGRRERRYSIRVLSDRSFGHLLRGSHEIEVKQELETDVVIVGGGVAGVSAATYLKDKDFLLFEGSDRLGGSSASDNWKDAHFALGAHYELAYPENYGADVLEFLQELGLIAWNRYSQLYEFTDKKYLIDPEQMEQCFYKGKPLDHVLQNASGADALESLLRPYLGKMPLPTRLIDEQYHELNTISFESFLRNSFDLSKDLKRRIDYQMLDDWGATSSEVSALAGIHYYTCRPYNEKEVPLFSAPNGNSYFIEHMIGSWSKPESIRTNSLVGSVKEEDGQVVTKVIHHDRTATLVKSKKLIYAGQKHALPYIMDKKLLVDFEAPEYAPWVVLNFVCKTGVQFDRWQNDVLTDKLEFLGFVNSQKQVASSRTLDVFTAYYCFASKDRKLLVKMEESPESIVEATLDLIEKETETSLRSFVEHVTVKFMGHAMPKPVPGYLSFDKTRKLGTNIYLAGVDTGRLPLFFEACDSGLQAAKQCTDEINVL